uniref:Uncharacterized protein n=1 Tax=Desulfobacca acetoxidans TaxID=60893 RepID=A0A7V4G909_9BACT
MMKRLKELWHLLRRDRGRLLATVRMEFYGNKEVLPTISWENSQEAEGDVAVLAAFYYARILYELAEINETRSAKELMVFITQVLERVMTPEGPVGRPRLPLGELTLTETPSPEPPARSYRAELFRLRDGKFRLDFSGTLGKEGVYLPATFVIFLQHCINQLPDEALTRMARALNRLHLYYKYRRDFWDSTALTAGPAFALSQEELRPEEMVMEE